MVAKGDSLSQFRLEGQLRAVNKLWHLDCIYSPYIVLITLHETDLARSNPTTGLRTET